MRKSLSRYNLSRAALFLVALFIVVYFLPRSDSERFSYVQGRPWVHALLTAPFDIPVYRDSVTMNQKIDSIDLTFSPVFSFSATPRDTLRAAINNVKWLLPQQRSHLTATLDSVYTRGIVSRDEALQLKADNREYIQIKRDRTLHSTVASELLTPRSAYALIDSLIHDPAERKALQQIKLSTILTPNLRLDTMETHRLRDEKLLPITAATGIIQQGERIIDRGDVVTPQLATILATYEAMAAERFSLSATEHLNNLLGQVILAVIVLSMLFVYLYIYRHDIYDNFRILGAVVTILLLFYVLTVFASAALPMGALLVPYAIIAILAVVFFDTNTALFLYVMELMVCVFFTTYPVEFFVIELTVGIATIFSLRELSRRIQLLRTAVIAFVAYLVSYLAVELVNTSSINSFSWDMVGYFAINLVLVNFAYIMIFIFEKAFGLISAVTLVELSDINNPLLRKLSEQCPGTFQHSMSVSNLASNAAARIGANEQLIRAGALYHDIGKTRNPAFFTENQYGVNPHDALNPEQSARVLHNHVYDGLKMADQEKLPRVIRDLIAQHHGAGKAKYFYTKYARMHPGEVIDDALFSYPGPNPQTREASLLMMADAVEAASRSLTDYSPESISRLVNGIVDGQVAEGLHRESPLSFRDIQQAKEAFISRLRTMYHSRIAYPK